VTRRRGRAVALTAAASAVLVVAAVAAGTGPLIGSKRAGLLPLLPRRPGQPLPGASVTAAPATLPPPGPKGHATPLGDFVNAVGLAILVAGLAAIAMIAVFALVRAVRQWMPRTARSRGADRVVAESGDDTLDEATRRHLSSAVAAAMTDLDESADPRHAVLGCWLRLEDAVARSGAARAPAETSAELARRVLTGYAVQPADLDRLHGLYQRARYSAGGVPPGARDQARAALDTVRRGIERAAPTPVTAGPTQARP
jgi:uncharacterized protein DUF4129